MPTMGKKTNTNVYISTCNVAAFHISNELMHENAHNKWFTDAKNRREIWSQVKMLRYISPYETYTLYTHTHTHGEIEMQLKLVSSILFMFFKSINNRVYNFITIQVVVLNAPAAFG